MISSTWKRWNATFDPYIMNYFRLVASAVVLFLDSNIQAQCDPDAVDFGEETWGLNPDGETTFFDGAILGVAYTDDVHLLVPSFAIDVVPDTPLNAPIDSVVIESVVLVDPLTSESVTFAEVGLEYSCNNNGDCVDPCTFLGGGQYCATFSGVPTVSGEFELAMEVNVWSTVFGFPLATPFSFDGLAFSIVDPANSVNEQGAFGLSAYPNPASDQFTLVGTEGVKMQLMGAEGRLIKAWTATSSQTTLACDDWAEGVYFLRMEKGEAVQVRRLLVQR